MAEKINLCYNQLIKKEQKNHHRKNENTVNNIENTADNANSVNNAHSLSRYENVSTATHNIAAIASCEYNNMEDAIPVKFSATNLPAIVDEIVGDFNDDVDEVAQEFKVIYANSKDNDRMIELRIIGKHHARFVPPEYDSHPARDYINKKGTYNVVIDLFAEMH